MWGILAAALAIASWFYITSNAVAANPGRSKAGLTLSVLVRLLIPIILLGSGFILEPLIISMIQNDPSIRETLPNEFLRAACIGLAAGSVIAIVADRARNSNDRLVNTAIASVLALLVVDNFASIFIGRSSNFAFSMLADVVGGAIAGAFVGIITDALKRKEAAS